jgi:hypothetical protein
MPEPTQSYSYKPAPQPSAQDHNRTCTLTLLSPPRAKEVHIRDLEVRPKMTHIPQIAAAIPVPQQCE